MSLIEKPKGEPFDNGQPEASGQYTRYAVLPSGQRKAFVRPYRESYQHVGDQPRFPLVDLTEEQLARYQQYGYVKYESYPEGTISGRFWTQKQLDAKGCNTITTMGRELSETYAADPTYYGSTFCCGCHAHLPVSEFIWTLDGQRVGS